MNTLSSVTAYWPNDFDTIMANIIATFEMIKNDIKKVAISNLVYEHVAEFL